MKIRNRAVALLGGAALGVAVLAGCSTSSTGAAPTTTTSPQYADLTSWQVALDKCMTDNGANPLQMGGTVGRQQPTAPAPATIDPAVQQQIGNKCLQEVGDPPGQDTDPDAAAKAQQASLEFFKCLQDAGYDVPTPQNTGGNGNTTGIDLSGVPDDVVQTCRSESGF